MTNHTFLGGMGLGILAGAAMGMAVTAKGMQNPKMRRMAKKATQKMEQMKDDLADTMERPVFRLQDLEIPDLAVNVPQRTRQKQPFSRALHEQLMDFLRVAHLRRTQDRFHSLPQAGRPAPRRSPGVAGLS